MKRILSFFLAPRAAAQYQQQYTNLCNFGVKITFSEQFDHQSK